MFRKMKLFVAMLLVLGICTDAVLAELIGYWPFDEGQGTEASDITGNGNDGTFNGTVEWVPGYKGGAVRFDTAGERVVIGPLDPSAENNAMTLAAWINWEGEGHSIEHQGIIGKRLGWDTTGNTIKWFWETTPTGDLVFRADYSGGGTGLWWGNGILAPYVNEWTHVALTWDDGAAVQYINGEEVSSGNITFRDTANDTPVTIGCVDSTNNETFVGSIDEVRIYNHALTPPEIQTIMLGIFPTAFSPDPADGALHADTWVNISWKPGTSAVSHDVYLGDNFDEVNAGAESVFQGNQASTFYVVGFPGFAYPDGLVPGTTYYWRIDEVNDLDPNSPWRGDVWSFSIPPKTAYAPVPADTAEQVDPDVTLRWTAGFGSKLHTVYFGDNFDDVNNATGGLPQGTTTYDPGTLKLAKTYYWRVDEFDIIETYKGDVWSFTTEGAVGNPNPANGAVDVKQTQIITFSPSVYAASHELYFGTDKDVVKNADTGSPEYKGTRDLGAESYDPGKLELDATYYWRIDEVNNANPDSPWTGILWSFTTAGFLVVDDFEDYDSGDNQIWYSWKDGLGYAAHDNEPAYPGNGTGSAVGDENTASFTEETIVHGGNQSMPFWYDNSILMYSEVEKTLTYPRDWTENGVSTLSIWFRGNSDNAAETLYVALNGNAIVTHDNPNASQVDEWTQWNIDLSTPGGFADQGVNLANVNTIAIGFGDKNNPLAGGSGMMYFDDIRLYAPSP
ncbi:MAG TPA: LamG domain-containing protein [Sedimentisphaerales bacterium]|nr:LamG domain-containing protein [Sedimentisphaerales bacterium]